MLAMTFAACSDNDTDYLPARHFDDATAPSVVSVSPEDGASELDTFVNVVVTYDEPVYAAPNTTIKVYTDDSTFYYVDDTLSYTEGNQLIIPLHAKAAQNYKIQIMKPSVRDSGAAEGVLQQVAVIGAALAARQTGADRSGHVLRRAEAALDLG